MASRDLNDLCRPVCLLARSFELEVERAGIDILVTCTYRSEAEQAALFSQGRESLAKVNRMRVGVGLPRIGDRENRRIVTWAKPGDSLHQWRCAFDVVLLQAGKAVWDIAHPSWQKIGKIGVSCGLEWGGNWTVKKREFPHFQYLGGLTLKEIQGGKVPHDYQRVLPERSQGSFLGPVSLRQPLIRIPSALVT